MERIENGCESVERGQGDLRRVAVFAQVQAYDMRKGMDPTTLFYVRCHDCVRAANQQGVGVMRRGIGKIRERLFPSFGVFDGIELYLGEKVLSSARNP